MKFSDNSMLPRNVLHCVFRCFVLMENYSIVFENDKYIVVKLSNFVLFAIKNSPMVLKTIRNKDSYADFRIISCKFVI